MEYYKRWFSKICHKETRQKIYEFSCTFTKYYVFLHKNKSLPSRLSLVNLDKFINMYWLSWRRFLSYRNQTIDLLCKSMDWLIYDWISRHERVKEILNPFMANTSHHIEANQLICNTNQLVGFYMMVNIGCECVNGKLLCSENLFKVNANFPERDPRTLFDQVDTRP